jgi:hypothetical protein
MIRREKIVVPLGIETDLELLDVEGVRDLLRASTDGSSGTFGTTEIRIPSGPNPHITFTVEG